MQNKKVVAITGCSSGIGRAATFALADLGYHVIATVRKQDDALIFEDHRNIDSVLLELQDQDSVASAAQEILTLANGHLFALFNNAAYGQPGAIEDISRCTLRQQFEVNVFGTHQLTCLLLPALLAQKDARIVQNSSILGFIGMPMRGAYVATKFALEGLSDTLRMELDDTSVKVSIIEPGPILSKFRANALVALESNVDFGKSRHGWRYEAALERLSKDGPASKYTLSPDAVVKKLVHALSSEKPRARYYVTQPTYFMGFLTRILPARIIDRILLTFAKSE